VPGRVDPGSYYESPATAPGISDSSNWEEGWGKVSVVVTFELEEGMEEWPALGIESRVKEMVRRWHEKGKGEMEVRVYELMQVFEGVGQGKASGDGNVKASYLERGLNPCAILASIEPSSGAEEEIGKWYREEHLALVAEAPGYLHTRRYKLCSVLAGPANTKSSEAPRLMAVHEFADLGKLRSPLTERTEWTDRVLGCIERIEAPVFRLLVDKERGNRD